MDFFRAAAPYKPEHYNAPLPGVKKTPSCRKTAAWYVNPRRFRPEAVCATAHAFPLARRKCPTAVFNRPPLLRLVVLRRDIRGQKQAERVACNKVGLHEILQKCHLSSRHGPDFFMVPGAVSFGSPVRIGVVTAAPWGLFATGMMDECPLSYPSNVSPSSCQPPERAL